MSAGLLLITHDRIGEALLEAAESALGVCPLRAAVLSVAAVSDRDELLARARELVAALDEGHGVVILTDMYGATPGNIATMLQREAREVAVIAGVNLPMLIRLLNYPQLGLAQMVDKALSGGREGIFVCKAEAGP